MEPTQGGAVCVCYCRIKSVLHDADWGRVEGRQAIPSVRHGPGTLLNHTADPWRHETPNLDWNAEFRMPNFDSVNLCTTSFRFSQLMYH
jgi:hypothetical protein